MEEQRCHHNEKFIFNKYTYNTIKIIFFLHFLNIFHHNQSIKINFFSSFPPSLASFPLSFILQELPVELVHDQSISKKEHFFSFDHTPRTVFQDFNMFLMFEYNMKIYNHMVFHMSVVADDKKIMKSMTLYVYSDC